MREAKKAVCNSNSATYKGRMEEQRRLFNHQEVMPRAFNLSFLALLLSALCRWRVQMPSWEPSSQGSIQQTEVSRPHLSSRLWDGQAPTGLCHHPGLPWETRWLKQPVTLLGCREIPIFLVFMASGCQFTARNEWLEEHRYQRESKNFPTTATEIWDSAEECVFFLGKKKYG